MLETYLLRDIADVVLEAQTDSDGDAMYRVATVMADGTRHAWTGYYSSGRVGKGTVVNAAREFLDLAPGAGPAAPAATLSAGQRRASGCLFGAMAAFCLLFLGIGARMAWVQHHRLATYQPVPVTVLGTSVEEVSGDDGSTYRPVVTYRYEVAGRAYVASRVTPLNESRGRRWARDLADRFAVNERYTGYYDPARPQDAFLLRRSSVFPYVFMGIPAVALVLLAHTAAWQRREGRG